MVIVLVRDLIFVSRVTATARAVGAEVSLVRDAGGVERSASGARRMLVDANLAGALEAAAAYKCRSPNTAIVAFVAHTDGQTIARARESGVDKLLARSAFFEHLESFLDCSGVSLE